MLETFIAVRLSTSKRLATESCIANYGCSAVRSWDCMCLPSVHLLPRQQRLEPQYLGVIWFALELVRGTLGPQCVTFSLLGRALQTVVRSVEQS